MENENNPSLKCRLTSAALRERKNTVIASMKTRMLERSELPGGFAYRFSGTDEMLDDLVEFMKTERQCCDFFDFDLKLKHDTMAWLHITGPAGAKDFLVNELGL